MSDVARTPSQPETALAVGGRAIDRRSFLKRGGALGLTVASASGLLAACVDEGGPTTSVGAAAGGSTLSELSELPNNLEDMYDSVEGKSFIYIGIFGAHPQIQFYDQLFAAEAERLGMEYAYIDAAFDPAKEIEALNEAISRAFDAIILHPVDPAGASPQVRRAREEGVVVLNIQTDTIERPTIKHGWNWYQNGVITANWMGERLGGEGRVVGITGVAGTSHGDGRTAGFQDTIASSWPGIEIVEWAEGAGYTQEGGYDIAEALLRRHSDIDAIAGLEDQQAIGARRAAIDLGRSDGLIVTGADGQREGQQAVADGLLDMSVMMTRGFGPEALGAIDMLEAMLRGKVHGNAIQAAHFPPQLAVTAENIGAQWQSPI